MRLKPFGDAAILAELAPQPPTVIMHELHGRDGDSDPSSLAPTLALALALAAADLPGVTDVVPAERSVLVRFDRRSTTAADVSRAIHAAAGSTAEGSTAELRAGELVTIDVDYDGEDLAEAARLAGLTATELVEAHSAATWTVLFSGFAPGFGYLRCDDRRLDVPRRDTSRTRVPAGSVALAAGYSGIYPRSSPGGWQLIGRTDADLWNVRSDPPALLRPGVQVRFQPR